MCHLIWTSENHRVGKEGIIPTFYIWLNQKYKNSDFLPPDLVVLLPAVIDISYFILNVNLFQSYVFIDSNI